MCNKDIEEYMYSLLVTLLGGLMRWKCIEIKNSCVVILKNSAHCTTVLKLNAKQKMLSISYWDIIM